jgi:hypothetical protein
MIGFNERTDNKEKIGLEGTGSEVCGCVTSSLRGGLHAIKVIDELHSEHQKNGHDGGQVAKFVAASQARHGAGCTH